MLHLPELRKELELAGTEGAEVEREALSLLNMEMRAGDLPPINSIRRPGSILGGRFVIENHLGTGGMGEVYSARDKVLDIQVALKLIPLTLIQVQEVRDRFRKEVLLARSVTHPNVVRIYDLYEDSHELFLSMELLRGQTLAERLKTGVLRESEAQDLGQQVASGLVAIHGKEIIHRDLKPQNIFLEEGGRVVIMDFGIARDQRGIGGALTRTGQMIGTPNYLAPEQVAGKSVSKATDVYGWGLVLYECLTGKLPFVADAGMEHLVRRVIEDSPKLSAQTSSPLTQLIDQALLRDPGKRPQVLDLQHSLAGKPMPRRLWLYAAAALPVTIGGAYWAGRSGGLFDKAAALPRQAVRILIADIVDRLGDPNLEGTLESVLALGLEEASFVSIFQRVDAKKIAAQLRPAENGKPMALPEDLARLVAVREGIDLVVGGEVSKTGQSIQLAVFAHDAISGKEIGSENFQAESKKNLLDQAGKAAEMVRKKLGDNTPESRNQAAAETFSATSLEAAHFYAKGQESSLLGQWDAAIASYDRALAVDPNLGRAWSGLAVVYRNLGQTAKALEFFQKALANLNRMSERERFRTRGAFYVTQQSPAQALQEYQALARAYPADSAGHSNLALTNLLLRKAQPALEEGRQAVAIYPRNRIHRNNLALYALFAGQFEESLQEALKVIEQDPKFLKAYLSKALALTGLGRAEEARATWQQATPLGDRGSSLGQLGLADLSAGQGDYVAAIKSLETSITVERDAKRLEALYWRQAAMAQVLAEMGETMNARKAALEAAKSNDDGALIQAGCLLASLGAGTEANLLANKLAAKPGPSSKHAALLVRGVAALFGKKLDDATRLLEEALATLDSWLCRYWRGRLQSVRQQWLEAGAEFDLCHQRRGEAMTAFIDDLPTYRLLPVMYFYRGKAELGLNPKGGAASLEKFLEMRAGTDSRDTMTAEARKLLRK